LRWIKKLEFEQKSLASQNSITFGYGQFIKINVIFNLNNRSLKSKAIYHNNNKKLVNLVKFIQKSKILVPDFRIILRFKLNFFSYLNKI
jgi:hypothetical protein